MTSVVPLGHPGNDLGQYLRQHLWRSQPQPKVLRVSDATKYMWVLRCQKHLRLMTVQAAFRQLHDPKHPGQLTQCERCTCSYRHSPEPLPDERHRSYWEQVAWVQLENVLRLKEVQEHMSANSCLHGIDLGFVVEARIVQRWPASVDIYVPAIHLIIQVDGEHHDDTSQQEKDARFNELATSQGHRVLRLHYLDVHSFFTYIYSAARRCMQCTTGRWLTCTTHHPLSHQP
jgi:very-short-patch-repair endonuclease